MDQQQEPAPVPVFFLSDSTGISAETMGNALLIQFPELRFERRLIPFIATADGGSPGRHDPRRRDGGPGDPAGLHDRRDGRGP